MGDDLGTSGLRFEREGPIAWCTIDRPEARKIHLNLTYMVMLGGAVYFHFRRGRDSGS